MRLCLSTSLLLSLAVSFYVLSMYHVCVCVLGPHGVPESAPHAIKRKKVEVGDNSPGFGGEGTVCVQVYLCVCVCVSEHRTPNQGGREFTWVWCWRYIDHLTYKVPSTSFQAYVHRYLTCIITVTIEKNHEHYEHCYHHHHYLHYHFYHNYYYHHHYYRSKNFWRVRTRGWRAWVWDRTRIGTYMLHCCYAIVTLLHSCYTVVILLLHCCYTAVTFLLHCCNTAVTLLLHCWMCMIKRMTRVG
jgi:hypothetical protein